MKLNRRSMDYSMIRGIIFVALAAIALLLITGQMIPMMSTTRVQQCKMSLQAAKLTKGWTGQDVLDINCPPRSVVLTDKGFIDNNNQMVNFWVGKQEYNSIPLNKKDSGSFLTEAVENTLANELYSCWNIANQGDFGDKTPYSVPGWGDKIISLLCSNFKIDSNFKNKKYIKFSYSEFVTYLKTHAIPTTSQTYFDYLNITQHHSVQIFGGNLASWDKSSLQLCGDGNLVNLIKPKGSYLPGSICYPKKDIDFYYYKEYEIAFMTFQKDYIDKYLNVNYGGPVYDVTMMPITTFATMPDSEIAN